MANLRFNVRVFLDNPGALPELQARTKDLSPAFEAIFQRWVKLNEQNFDQSKGAEASGAFIFDEFWQSLSTGYMEEKHPTGAPKRKRIKVNAEGYREYPDWLMVRTGALREAMMNPAALFKEIGEDDATFGTPNDPDLADIVRWQSGERQKHRNIVFLSEPTMRGIKKILQEYLGLGGQFKTYMFAKGLQAVALEKEMAAMDAEFVSEVYQ